MKKLFLAGILLFTGLLNASAQNKIGYISIEDLINVMPEAAKANTELQDYQTALTQQGNDYMKELTEKDSLFVIDSPKLSPSIKELRRNDLVQLYQKVQNWNQTAQQLMQQKQQALSGPIHDKAIEVIKQVAKENGYTYIIDAAALLASPPGDDILPLVKKKLGVTDKPAEIKKQ